MKQIGNLTIALLIVQSITAAVLSVDAVSPGLDDLEVWVAREAMNLVELSHLCDDLAAQISGGRTDGTNLADLLASLSDRLEAVRTALDGLEAQIRSMEMPESDVTAGLLKDIELLRSQNAALREKLQILRKAAYAGPPLAEGGSTDSRLVTSALGKAAYAMLVVSQEMRGSFLDISSIIGAGIGTLARLSDATGGRLPVGATPGLVVTVFAVLLAFALVSMAIQTYYREAFDHRADDTRIPGLLVASAVPWGDVSSPTGGPFLDISAKGEATGRAGKLSDADEEYAIMLLKLGYREEALRVVSPGTTTRHSPRGQAPPRDGGQTDGSLVGRAGPGPLGRQTRRDPARHFGQARRLYKKAFNSLIIAGRRSRRYKMGPIRRAGKKP